jgi:hypothetical protein
MTLDLRPEIVAALKALASANGLSVEEYVEHIVQRETPPQDEDAPSPETSGMVWENGLFVYRTGRPASEAAIGPLAKVLRGSL